MTATHINEGSSMVHGQCGCGCVDCQGECCQLECLLRPNFYSGQLLTDGDLKALVDWVEAKSSLQRFHDGWGVACGLEVTCSHKDKEQGRVYVSEGYAVDCCGRDIVVCEPIWYDFKCEKPTDPCCRDRRPDPNNSGPAPGTDPNEPKLGGLPLSELRAFELCLSLDEQMTGGQRALTRGNCAPMGDCQYTRVRQNGRLFAKEIEDPCATQSEGPDEIYRRKIMKLREALDLNKSSAKTLLNYISGKLHSFCFVEDQLCRWNKENENKPGNLNLPGDLANELLFYIIQDFRNHYFQSACQACDDNLCDGDGAPLARVWVWDKRDADCRICKVVYIDSYPPFRRLLGLGGRAEISGCVDLTPYIWRDKSEVLKNLSRLGFSQVSEETIDKTDPPNWLDDELICASAGTTLRMRVCLDFCHRERVVSFSIGTTITEGAGT